MSKRKAVQISLRAIAVSIGAILLLYGRANSLRADAQVTSTSPPTPTANLHTVFLVMMENYDWASIKGNRSAPYINQTLLPMGAHAENYFNPPGLHPSEPNYLWLEGGTNFGVTNDADPKFNHIDSPDHLVTLLEQANSSWKAYQEGIDGKTCPLVSHNLFAVKHNGTLFFNDVTDSNDPNSAHCIAHERPYRELATDLSNNTVAAYNLIIPNLCNDMHNSGGCTTSNSVRNGDTWLAQQIPSILNSQPYQNGGVIFIVWDEGEGNDGPIGLIALSPDAKPGYSNTIHYTHSSTLRTIQEILGVTPLLGDAANATDLSDLFVAFP
ncbi:MAG: alkaline phosphatase family protein [Aggregatilineales bacterium]